jgi:hypothetical protein
VGDHAGILSAVVFSPCPRLKYVFCDKTGKGRRVRGSGKGDGEYSAYFDNKGEWCRPSTILKGRFNPNPNPPSRTHTRNKWDIHLQRAWDMHPSTGNIQTVPNESHRKVSKSEICVLQVNEDTYGIESCGAEVCRLFFTLSSKQHILHSHHAGTQSVANLSCT